MGLAAPAAFLAFLFLVQPASADTITFVDTTNTTTVDHVGSQHNVSVLPGGCSPTDEAFQCQIVITSTTGAPGNPTMSLNISEAGVDPTHAVSDYVQAMPGTNSYLVIFASDQPGDPGAVLGLTPLPGAPSISETGGVQAAFTLSWTDGTQDIIQFHSDLDPVPEPGTLVLFGSGLVSMLGFARRKIFRV